MTQRFKNAIDALVYAFFNDTLAAGHCAACALGNIVAWSHGYKKATATDSCSIPGTRFRSSEWDSAIWHKSIYPDADVVIEKTGYCVNDLTLIEKAFESSTKLTVFNYHKKSKEEIMQDQYNGLMAVLDVLCEIEGIEEKEEYKSLFEFSA